MQTLPPSVTVSHDRAAVRNLHARGLTITEIAQLEFPVRSKNDDRLASALGKIVRDQREYLGLSQTELGERCDLHRTYISDIERGVRNLSLSTLETLAIGLELSTSQLVAQAEICRI